MDKTNQQVTVCGVCACPPDMPGLWRENRKNKRQSQETILFSLYPDIFWVNSMSAYLINEHLSKTPLFLPHAVGKSSLPVVIEKQ